MVLRGVFESVSICFMAVGGVFWRTRAEDGAVSTSSGVLKGLIGVEALAGWCCKDFG